MPSTRTRKAHAATRRPQATRATPVVEMREVTKVYDSGTVALERASLKIGRGEFVFLVGPTGCGKSTCIRLLLKELEASAGDILIAGKKLGDISRDRVPYLRRNIGVVFQDYKLLPNRTVYDNVAYSLQVIGESRQEIRRKVPDILRLVGLSTKLHSYPDELSGGEQQRVSMARAFVNHPPLLRRNIGTVFQDYKLLPNRTVYDNVAYSLQVIGEPRQDIRRKVPDILRLVGLSTKLHNFPDELSGGEQQRVSIARAL